MLILTRKVDEKLRVGDDVTITVISVKGHQVRFGIEAPRDIAVNREEIHQKILKERENAKVTTIVKRNT